MLTVALLTSMCDEVDIIDRTFLRWENDCSCQVHQQIQNSVSKEKVEFRDQTNAWQRHAVLGKLS